MSANENETRDSEPESGPGGLGLGRPPPRSVHRPLPRRRRSWVHQARIGGHRIYLTVGEYEDGAPGEIFIDMQKEGASFRAMLNAFAIVVSKNLQHGVPLEELVDTYVRTRFEPNGRVEGHPRVAWATSVPDYVFRVLGLEYLGRDDLAVEGPPEQAETDD